MVIPAPVSEFLFYHGGEFLFEHIALPGAKRILKQLMLAPSLKKIQSRLSITIRKDMVWLAGGEADKIIHFPLLINNPTPWELVITDVECPIEYYGVVIVRKPRLKETLPIVIPAESRDRQIELLYEPFSTTLGLPKNRGGWSIESGTISFHCYFGNFKAAIPREGYLEVITSQAQWDEVRKWSQDFLKGDFS